MKTVEQVKDWLNESGEYTLHALEELWISRLHKGQVIQSNMPDETRMLISLRNRIKELEARIEKLEKK